MGYEESEPYVVNDEGGEYIAQTPTEESARKHLIEYFTHQDALLDHIGTGNNATIDLTIAVAEFDLEHPDLYKFQPTAEWSRIQQALKERDELAAELERVKAENYQLKGNQRQYERQLSSLKSRLPVNADGDVVLWGDEVWFMNPDMCPLDPEALVCEKVESIYHGKGYKEYNGDFTITCDTYEAGNLDFHSTAESCRAANEKGEDDEN